MVRTAWRAARRLAVVVPIVIAGLFWAAPHRAAITTPSTSAVGYDAPYAYFAWGSPPDPVQVMHETGLHDFTLAFIIARDPAHDPSCAPAWNGVGKLVGNAYSRAITAIRHAGGNVAVSFGGASGPKLGAVCTTPAALASAYEKAVSVLALTSIDVDIEGNEVANADTRDREIAALALVRHAYPHLYISVTFPSNENGPDANGKALIATAADDGFSPDAWTIMPFDFGQPVANMATVTMAATKGLVRDVASSYGISSLDAYEMSGISTMNGQTDERDEVLTLAQFRTIASFGTEHHLARLTYWALNRDRPCTKADQWGDGACSRLAQAPWAFTAVDAAWRP